MKRLYEALVAMVTEGVGFVDEAEARVIDAFNAMAEGAYYVEYLTE